jgi:hypothetical protein
MLKAFLWTTQRTGYMITGKVDVSGADYTFELLAFEYIL